MEARESCRVSVIDSYNDGEKKLYIGINLTPLTDHDLPDIPGVNALSYSGRVFAQPSIFMDMLVYSIDLHAWYKYNVNSVKEDADITTDTNYDREWVPFLTDIVPVSMTGKQKLDVITTDASDVIVTSTASVVTSGAAHTTSISSNVYPTIARYGYHTVQSNNVWFSFATSDLYYTDDFRSSFVLDPTYPTTGAPDYAVDFSDNCFVDTFHIAFNDLSMHKQIPYLHTLFKHVDTMETDGSLEVVGSCTHRVSWNWTTGSQLVKYGTPYKSYKSHMLPVVYSDDANDTIIYPVEYVVNRHRVRGRGRSIGFRFEMNTAVGAALTADQYRFHLVGWQAKVDV